MGLGKTLQSICILASDHRRQKLEYEVEWIHLLTLTECWMKCTEVVLKTEYSAVLELCQLLTTYRNCHALLSVVLSLLCWHVMLQRTGDVPPLPSIVLCPPTLTGHWVYEVDKFVSPEYLHPLHYTGPPLERIKSVALLVVLQVVSKLHN